MMRAARSRAGSTSVGSRRMAATSAAASPRFSRRAAMMTTRIRFVALVATLLPCVAPAAALAAWPHDPNNGNVALFTAGGASSPLIVTDGAGGAIVAWQDHRGGIYYDVYAQRVSAAGVPL